jgi:hypothetical protein
MPFFQAVGQYIDVSFFIINQQKPDTAIFRMSGGRVAVHVFFLFVYKYSGYLD